MTKLTTPQSMRRHVVILGNTNAGKSTLFNALTGQDNAIVSPLPGTTTDPVSKAMELIPFGPIVLVDTPGLADSGTLGAQRMKKTAMFLRRADAALYVADAGDFSPATYTAFLAEQLPHLLVFTKCAGDQFNLLEHLAAEYPHAVFLKDTAPEIEPLRQKLSALLTGLEPEDAPLIGDLVKPGGTVVLVVPIDSEAPKGRISLPQVQVLRDCLDHGIKAMVVRETELADALESLWDVDLVITDSQAFGQVNDIVPERIPLTSFSMVLARQRGGFAQLIAGAGAVDTLPDGAVILMLEGCTHNHTHEDIGRIKIPAMLEKRTGKKFRFQVYSGYDFPETLSDYGLAVQCGSCMLSGREVRGRLHRLETAGVPATNYGMLLAWGTGILARSSEIFAGRVQ